MIKVKKCLSLAIAPKLSTLDRAQKKKKPLIKSSEDIEIEEI